MWASIPPGAQLAKTAIDGVALHRAPLSRCRAEGLNARKAANSWTDNAGEMLIGSDGQRASGDDLRRERTLAVEESFPRWHRLNGCRFCNGFHSVKVRTNGSSLWGAELHFIFHDIRRFREGCGSSGNPMLPLRSMRAGLVATLLAGCGASIRKPPPASAAAPLVPSAYGGAIAFPRAGVGRRSAARFRSPTRGARSPPARTTTSRFSKKRGSTHLSRGRR